MYILRGLKISILEKKYFRLKKLLFVYILNNVSDVSVEAAAEACWLLQNVDKYQTDLT
jgi:hypothetical protein